VVLGELGLNGELRAVPQIERRVGEASRLGFKSCLLPKLTPVIASTAKQSLNYTNIQLIEAGSVAEALRLGLGKRGYGSSTLMGED